MALTALLLSSFPAGAQSGDPSARRRELQREQARKASEIQVLRASEAELERALDTLEASVRSEETAAAQARAAAASAAAAVVSARAAENRARNELERIRDEVRSLAVESYIRGNLPASVQADADSIDDVGRAQVFIDTVVGKRSDLTDKMNAALADLAEQRARAEAAQREANARQREVAASLGAAQAARNRQRDLANQVDARLERALGEAASIERLDRQLAAEIRARQASLAARAAPAASRSGGTGSSVRRTSNPSLRTVRGITVAAEIADNLAGLLDASDGAGLSLGGQGWRSSEGQIQARRQNCGTSDYDIYEKPASQCNPPTARPGESMHERGLAVDFTNGGRLITSRSDPAFVWLKANASRFGFYNLPSEPWHWSTNGN